MTETLRTAAVNLTALSPLYVGAGDEYCLSPYTDFIQDGRDLVYIDERKLHEFLAEKPELVEEFVSGIREGYDNNRSSFSLAGFLAVHLGNKRRDIEKRRVAIEGEIGKNQVRRFIASSGRPYIPGSSIKGAVRTAVLLDWLSSTRKGRQQLDEIRTFVEKRSRRDLHQTAIDRACFGSISRDAFRLLRISDTEPIESSAVCVSEIKRVALYPPSGTGRQNVNWKSDIPQWSETLRPGTRTTFTVALMKPRDRTGFPFLDEQKLARLFASINSFSRESCQRELDELEERPGEFDRFHAFYEQLETQIDSLRDNEAVMRLGGGKTWFDNSIGLAIDNEEFGEESLFEAYLSLLKIGNSPFPSTRSVAMSNGRPDHPLGWVKLSFTS
jgi:CRISPR-associated protein Csm5